MSDKKEDKNNANTTLSVNSQDIRKSGILRKLKTMKKKYFVLRTESNSGPARLEYYDNEKKFKSGGTAKRSIAIKTCFNINRKVDAKHKFAITLYTKDDSFSVVADNEESVEEWLNAMLELQLDGPCLTGGAKLKPKFEHVWQVTVGDKSLASSRNMKGLYRLCLTPSSLTLIKVDQSDPPETLEFPLMSIRRCGHTNNYFVIELGRSSITGAGELWLETEDGVIAQNMHEVTLNAMKSCREHEDICPVLRPRSASNSENSRPITSRPRPVAVVSPQAYSHIRDRCDSLPSRPRTISEGQEINNRGYYAPQSYMDSLRPYGGYNRTVSYSPPTISNPLSPVSATCSTDSAGSSLSIDEFDGCQQTDFALGRYLHNLPTDGALHTEPPIKEEQLDDYVPMSMGNNNNNTEGYISMAPTIISTSAPTRPSIFLHLNSADSAHTSSLPPVSQSNDYMEMKSPLDGYINMSPIGANLDVLSSSPLTSSMNDSSQTKDGYIHMAPVHDHCVLPQHEGYLDMAPLSSSLPKTFSVSANQAISLPSRKDSSSKLSDTAVSSPSSTNLEDFPLDKVKSFLADADDGSFDSYIRPVRAYSMGSRPQPKKSHLSLQVDGSRIRAYSVGSQAQRKISNPVDKEIGSLMKIDPRTGAKSSSAPLLNNRPPRIRSSTSRGEVGEDLMEIDYNKTKYSSTGIDLSDSYTLEPVGRARSGSYSSSSNSALRLLHNRDKIKSQSTGHSSSSVKDDVDSTTDYLTMSPLTDQGKSTKVSSSTSKNEPVSKKIEALHPPGDYVSLDPSCTYTPGDKYLAGANSSTERTNVYSGNQDSKNHSLSTSILSKANDCDNAAKSSNKESVNGGLANTSPNKLEKQTSDYMCMNYKQNSENKDSLSKIQSTPNSHSSHSISNLEKEECEYSPVKNSLAQQSNEPNSPVSKTAPFTSTANFVPKTPPPSPSYGPLSAPLSGLPLVDNVVRRLSQPLGSIAVQSAPNCGEIRLNYASLDLPPASEEDGKGTTSKLKKPTEEEVQEVSLMYAQIDFSPVRQKTFQETESLSHL